VSAVCLLSFSPSPRLGQHCPVALIVVMKNREQAGQTSRGLEAETSCRDCSTGPEQERKRQAGRSAKDGGMTIGVNNQ